jgi:hypothetical protein
MPKISDMLRAGKGLAENSPRNRKRSSNKRPSFDKKLLASTHKAFAAAGYSMVSPKEYDTLESRSKGLVGFMMKKDQVLYANKNRTDFYLVSPPSADRRFLTISQEDIFQVEMA